MQSSQQSTTQPLQNYAATAPVCRQKFAFPAVPRLLPDLRLALSTLYSIPVYHHDLHRPTPAQAHEFLIHIQSRNVLRKMQSLQQKLRDQQQSETALQQQQQPSVAAQLQGMTAGSSWLACLAVLCQVQVQYNHGSSSPSSFFVASATERLFAAQTLVHRLRRNKAVEAIDMEMELFDHDNNTNYGGSWLHHYDSSSSLTTTLASSYQEWMCRHIHPGIAQVLETFCNHSTNTSTMIATTKNEEQIKLELCLVTLAAMGFFHMTTTTTAGAAPSTMEINPSSSTSVSISQTPLLETIMSAMVMTALRLRHCFSDSSVAGTSSSGANHFDTNSNTESGCLVTLLRNAFQVVSLSMAHQPHQQQGYDDNVNHVLQMCLYTSLAVVPDMILASPGGARSRLSMDPRMIQHSIGELRTRDMCALWDILHQDSVVAATDEQATRQNEYMILKTCARWAGLLALPHELIEHTIPVIRKQFDPSSSCGEVHQKIALSYVMALVEGASWTVEQVMSMNLGLSSESSSQQQANKKRQSSRSKRRHKEVIERESSNDDYAQALAEVRHRGDMACLVILRTWDQLSAAACVSISSGHADGEGPMGCLAAAANACMPHLLRYPDLYHGRELFRELSEIFRLLCSSPNKSIRALSFEPLYSLHTTLVEVARLRGGIDPELEPMVVDHFVKCSLSLASSCEYPSNYFANLGERSDEDIEIERNDVRDILRTVSGSGEGGSTADVVSDHGPLLVTNRILSIIIHSCREAVTSANRPETALHAFSSLAKPLNFLAKYSCQTGASNAEIENILDTALGLLCEACQSVAQTFRNETPLTELLPQTRIVNIAIASLCPMIAARCQLVRSRPDLARSRHGENLSNLLKLALEVSILSVEKLPELAAESLLGQSQYDIRGTMRSPGGEDHVGCLSILRMTNEDETLTAALVDTAKSFMPRLCKLLQFLKSVELERGMGVHHGKGVCPQSRRILLGVICRLEMAAKECGRASEMLSEVFDHVVVTIATVGSHGLNEPVLAQMAEATFDLAAFPPAVVSTLFVDDNDSGGMKTLCLEALASSCLHGFQHKATTTLEITAATVQWNRLRAALFQLLVGTANPDLPNRAAEILCACINGECEAIQRQCNMGANCPSDIFNDHIVSPDVVPSGLFIQVVARLLQERNSNALLSNCVGVLTACKSNVIETIILPCPEPTAFVDPRPTLTEAWLLAMIELCSAECFYAEHESVLVDTATAMISLLFFPTMGKTEVERQSGSGMSLDGPHSLVLLNFLAAFFRLGPAALESVANRLASIMPVDSTFMRDQSCDATIIKCASIGAALFRVVQGSLPPWAVEIISSVYSGLFVALGKDPELFGRFLRASMEVRMKQDFGGVKAGELLSGRFFHNLSAKSKDDFVNQAVELCGEDNLASWKRLKGQIKQICGGKKKDTDFKQKPALTRWEFIRM